MKYAVPGTVSHGTLRSIDLLDTFASALEALAERNLYTSDGDERTLTALNARITDFLASHESMGLMPDEDRVDELLETAEELLEAFAPPGHYFGAHWGDGADFGFWPSDKEV